MLPMPFSRTEQLAEKAELQADFRQPAWQGLKPEPRNVAVSGPAEAVSLLQNPMTEFLRRLLMWCPDAIRYPIV